MLTLMAISACTSGDSSDPSTAASGTSAPQIANTTPSSDPVAFTTSNYSVDQSAGSVSVTVTRTGSATEAISINYATADGSAVGGSDYTAESGTLQWAENDSTAKSISIPISNTHAFSGDKSFEIALTDPSAAATIGSPSTATVTISGAASANVGALQLSDSSYAVSQAARSVTITVNRTGGAVGATAIAYATANGTASSGKDYAPTTGTLQWPDGDSSSKSFSVPISDATPFSGSKTFTIALSNASSGAIIGSPDSATVTIYGASSPAVGRVQLAASSYSVAQNGGSVRITVNRTGGASGAIGVSYSTASGTAAAGTNFTATQGALNWANGDAGSKTFSIGISNATPFSGTKTFTVVLSNPSGGATIASPGSATVAVSGDATPAGSLQLSASSYAVNQDAGRLTVTVNRTGGSNGTASVSYSTTSGTAVANADFTATSGTLNWANGDTAPKTFSIAISNATPFSGTKSFTIVLGNGNGAALGRPNSAIATISGDAVTTAGSLQLSASAYAIAQAAGMLTVTVNRTGGSNGAVAVSYFTADGTAVAGTDYTATGGTLNWANGDASSKTFSVPISKSTPFAGNRTFTITLSGPGGGATLSSPTSATVIVSGSATSVGSPGSTFWVYHNGVFYWGGDYSYGARINYADTSGDPLNGRYDIAVNITSPYGGFLPYAGGTVPLWSFVDNAYNYLTFAIKPTVANQSAQVYFVKVGDVPVGLNVNPFNGQYGPPPQVGIWTKYKIPLSDLGVLDTSVYKFAIQDMTGLSGNVFYLDDIGFSP